MSSGRIPIERPRPASSRIRVASLHNISACPMSPWTSSANGRSASAFATLGWRGPRTSFRNSSPLRSRAGARDPGVASIARSRRVCLLASSDRPRICRSQTTSVRAVGMFASSGQAPARRYRALAAPRARRVLPFHAGGAVRPSRPGRPQQRANRHPGACLRPARSGRSMRTPRHTARACETARPATSADSRLPSCPCPMSSP